MAGFKWFKVVAGWFQVVSGRPRFSKYATNLVFRIIRKFLKSLTICILYLSIISLKSGIEEK